MKTSIKQIRKAEQEVIDLECAIMWHKRAVRHKGFSNYSGMMSKEEIASTKERISSLRAFIRDNRKTFRPDAR